MKSFCQAKVVSPFHSIDRSRLDHRRAGQFLQVWRISFILRSIDRSVVQFDFDIALSEGSLKFNPHNFCRFSLICWNYYRLVSLLSVFIEKNLHHLHYTIMKVFMVVGICYCSALIHQSGCSGETVGQSLKSKGAVASSVGVENIENDGENEQSNKSGPSLQSHWTIHWRTHEIEYQEWNEYVSYYDGPWKDWRSSVTVGEALDAAFGKEDDSKEKDAIANQVLGEIRMSLNEKIFLSTSVCFARLTLR